MSWWDIETLPEIAPAVQGYILVGLVLFLLFCLALSVWSRQWRVVVTESRNGRIHVSRRAIREMMCAIALRQKHVRACACETRMRRGKLDVVLSLRLDSDARLREVRDELLKLVKTYLERNFGFENLGRIDISVTAVKPPAPKIIDEPPKKRPQRIE